jgi:hypothetical protein
MFKIGVAVAGILCLACADAASATSFDLNTITTSKTVPESGYLSGGQGHGDSFLFTAGNDLKLIFSADFTPDEPADGSFYELGYFYLGDGTYQFTLGPGGTADLVAGISYFLEVSLSNSLSSQTTNAPIGAAYSYSVKFEAPAEAPIPASLPLFISALGGLVLLLLDSKRKSLSRKARQL